MFDVHFGGIVTKQKPPQYKTQVQCHFLLGVVSSGSWSKYDPTNGEAYATPAYVPHTLSYVRSHAEVCYFKPEEQGEGKPRLNCMLPKDPATSPSALYHNHMLIVYRRTSFSSLLPAS